MICCRSDLAHTDVNSFCSKEHPILRYNQLSFTSQVIDLNSDVDPLLYFGARIGKNLLLHNGFFPFDVNISFLLPFIIVIHNF